VKVIKRPGSKLPAQELPKFPVQIAIASGSGMLMGLTPAPVNAWWLAWIALAPLWVLLHPEFQGQSLKSKILLGLAWGFGYHSLAIFWITGIHPMTWMGVPWLTSLAIALFCWIFLSLWGATIGGAWAGIFSLLTQTRDRASSAGVRVLVGVALWCAIESVWSLGALWWTPLAYTQSPHNLVILHLGQLSGTTAVTGAIVAVNGLLAEAWINSRHQGKSIYWLPLSLFLVLHLIGFGLYSRPLADAPDAVLRVGIIQGNIPNTIKLYEEGWWRAIEGYTTGYESLADQGVDAVLTPETALPIQWTAPLPIQWTAPNHRYSLFYQAFYQAILQKRVPVWLGAFGGQGNTIANSLFMISADGETLGEYRKAKLVPLGEYIPFEQWLGGVIDRLSPLEAHMIAGTPGQQFDTPFGRAIVGICYESAFPEAFRRQTAAGGEFMLTASNNAHYSAAMPAQHQAQDVMRAIESDRWAARATNTGYSGIIDPHGRSQWISGLNTYEAHAGTIYRRSTQTLYVRWGDWLMFLLLGLGSIAWFGELRATRKTQ
jgi:apolipoprotein N-acyltransferase